MTGPTSANCFAPSNKTPRTPEKPKTNQEEAPDAPSRQSIRALTPFHTLDDSVKCESPTPMRMARNKTPNEPHLVNILLEAKAKLQQQNTKGLNLDIKNEVVNIIETAIQEALATQTQQIKNLQQDIEEIKAAIKSMNTTTSNKPPKTWAQVAGQRPKEPAPRSATERRIEHLDKIRREKERVELTLSMQGIDDETKKQLESMTEAELIRIIQDASNCHIRAIRKTPNKGIKIRCTSEEDANTLRAMDWEQAIPGTKVAKQRYGIVIHGVPKHNIDFEKDDMEDTRMRLEANNKVKIHKIAPLKRKVKNPNASTQSIVVHVDSLEEADECIEGGIIIEHRIHRAERYMPQCQITQCFNCQGYGHKAAVCKKPPRCGKCAKDHQTKECRNCERLECVHCQGEHEAWHSECPRRQQEFLQKEATREAIPPFYTKSC